MHKPGDRVFLSGAFEGQIGTVVGKDQHYQIKVDGYSYKRGGLEFHRFPEDGVKPLVEVVPEPEPELDPELEIEIEMEFDPVQLGGSLPEGLQAKAIRGGSVFVGCLEIPRATAVQVLKDLITDCKAESGEFKARRAGIQYGPNWITWNAAKHIKALLDQADGLGPSG